MTSKATPNLLKTVVPRNPLSTNPQMEAYAMTTEPALDYEYSATKTGKKVINWPATTRKYVDRAEGARNMIASLTRDLNRADQFNTEAKKTLKVIADSNNELQMDLDNARNDLRQVASHWSRMFLPAHVRTRIAKFSVK